MAKIISYIIEFIKLINSLFFKLECFRNYSPIKFIKKNNRMDSPR
jgi:hypothetical protein